MKIKLLYLNNNNKWYNEWQTTIGQSISHKNKKRKKEQIITTPHSHRSNTFFVFHNSLSVFSLRSKMANGCEICCEILIAILIPPLGVCLKHGCCTVILILIQISLITNSFRWPKTAAAEIWSLNQTAAIGIRFRLRPNFEQKWNYCCCRWSFACVWSWLCSVTFRGSSTLSTPSCSSIATSSSTSTGVRSTRRCRRCSTSLNLSNLKLFLIFRFSNKVFFSIWYSVAFGLDWIGSIYYVDSIRGFNLCFG